MLHTVIGFIFVLLSFSPAEASQAKQHYGWRYSALSMSNNGSFGGAFGNASKERAERLATDRCQKSAPAGSCQTMSVRFQLGSQNVDWLVGMRCKDQVFIVTGPARDHAIRLMWRDAYQAGFNPKVDCDLREEHLHTFPADSIFD